MISVRNHRLPLNGSKLIILVASLMLLIAGCKPKVRVLRPMGSKDEPKKETPAEKKDKEETDADIIDVKSIALLLPFQLNKANQHAPSTIDIRRSALALDFYQGFKLGLDALAAAGTNFKVNVLDTRDDVAENTRIAKLDEVRNAALVVGPVYPKEIQTFGFNASLDQALQISPLAASMPSEFNLPNLVTITSPISAHIKTLATHIAKQYSTGDVVLLYKTQDAASQQFLAPLKTEIQQLNKNISIVEVQDEESLESRVRLSGKNLVVLGTTNKYQISPVLAHLLTLKDELSYQIQLFGHPNWAKMDFDESEGLGAFQTRITSSYYIDKSASNVRKFDQQYQQEFGVVPTEFAYKGYDAAYYFGSLLAEYGEGYKDHITNVEYDGLHNTFKFEYNPSWGYVNNAISFMQYKGESFKPLK
ncbi:ABC transporter substrate-binding protein [Parapedobacter tibetensis]|uniref:ABC transporter substrate-binding protein n=1 Tax=Parapedobacter tibetensis TaxID=2972951 RepID=UPI00214D56DC|nr:ABC transporter substrate-binding protein [Parapedobacter tibetensis]